MAENSTTRQTKVRNAAVIIAVVAGLGGGIAFAAAGDDPDPGSNLSGAERSAANDAVFDEFQAKYAAWLESDYVKALDLKSVPRLEQRDETMSPSYGSLEEATDNADLAVLGVVENVDFVPYGIVTEFQVERTAKGEPLETVTVFQGSKLYPDQDFKTATLRSAPSSPVLVEGDRAVLLLEEAPPAMQDAANDTPTGGASSVQASRPVYRIQDWSGNYKVEKGKVKTVKAEQNKVRDVEGKSEKDVMDRIEGHAKKSKK